MDNLSKLLDNKATWKVCESVHLHLDTVFLPSDKKEEWDRARIDWEYCFDTAKTINVDKVTMQYVIRPECERYVRYNILPKLPQGWWTVKRCWMDSGCYPKVRQ